ncbi:MAG TPA: hypothetical protein VF840_11770 [Terriglobales bacterium]
MQIIVNLDGDRERAMTATRLDADPQFLSPEASLHEGRGKRVLRSSTENLLPGGEGQPVRRPGGRDRKCPTHVAAGIPRQEKQMLFQIRENPRDLVEFEADGLRDSAGPQGAVLPRQLAYHEVADQVMLARHECQARRHASRKIAHRLHESVFRQGEDVAADAVKDGRAHRRPALPAGAPAASKARLKPAVVMWYICTMVTQSERPREIQRVQTGIRIEKRVLKVLKAVAELKDMTVGDLLEGILLHVFEGKTPFSEASLRQISEFKKIYGCDLKASDSHHLKERRR